MLISEAATEKSFLKKLFPNFKNVNRGTYYFIENYWSSLLVMLLKTVLLRRYF